MRRANDLGSQFLRLFVVVVVEFKLDIHLHLRDDPRIGLPRHFVEKDVFAEVFRANKSELVIVPDVLDLAQPFLLDSKRFLLFVVIVTTQFRRKTRERTIGHERLCEKEGGCGQGALILVQLVRIGNVFDA